MNADSTQQRHLLLLYQSVVISVFHDNGLGLDLVRVGESAERGKGIIVKTTKDTPTYIHYFAPAGRKLINFGTVHGFPVIINSCFQ